MKTTTARHPYTEKVRATLSTAVSAAVIGLLAASSFGTTAHAQSNSPDDLVIGWSQRGISGSDWWKTMVAGGRHQAEKIGAKLLVVDANGDTVQQNQDIQTLMLRGADVVIVNPNDPIGLSSSINDLSKRNIPVVVVNSNLDDSLVPKIFCYVAEDQVATGALAGEVIAKKALKRWGDSGTIKLGAVGGFPGDVITELRFKGFMQGYNEVMKSHQDITTETLPMKYGSWKPDKALGPVRDMATANPDLDILFNESDVMLGGVNQALQLAGVYNHVLMGSYDGGMNAIAQMLEEPDGPLQATASNQPWDQAVLAVKMAVAAYKGKEDACPGKTNYVDTTVVTPATAEKYYNPNQTYVRAQE